ncbi:MAG: isochorismatase family protein [Acidobacteria bacterium]|nr:isochorismatase family protein [Acidobacteriota bacterium]
MGTSRLLTASEAVLVVVDVQEAFRSAIPEFSQIASRIAVAINGFEILGLPIIVTEQYPKGLGRTAEELTLSFDTPQSVIEKTTFSSYLSEDFTGTLKEKNIRQVLLCGVEAHVCVNQTAHDLLAAGYEVHLLTDGVASRFESDKKAGLKKMFSSGVIPSSVEMALFELMRDSRHEKFKDIQALVK